MASDHGFVSSQAKSSQLHQIILQNSAFRSLVLFIIAISTFFVWTSIQARPTSCSCGDSVQEAITNGCKFDAHAMAWLPDGCRDDELVSHFLTLGPHNGSWPFYTDQNATQELSLDELAWFADRPADENIFWTVHRWHVLHCVFYWKKLFRAGRVGASTEGNTNLMGHIEHCQGVFLVRDGLDAITTTGKVRLWS